MPPEKRQIKLLQAQRSLLADTRDGFFNREILNYLKKFFVQQAGLSCRLLFLLIFQALAEIALVVISYRYFRTNLYSVGAINYGTLLLILLALATIYLLTFFYLLKTERTLVIRLINDLRQRWFKIALQRSASGAHLTEKSGLLAKISYHLPLLNLGINNSLLGALRWALLVLILIFLAILFAGPVIWWALGGIILSLGLAWLGYLVAKNYVSQETTFYSKIIRLVDFSLSDWQFTKKFNQEKNILREFNQLVELDSYFRIRRDLWLRFGFAFVFVALIFLGLALNFWQVEISQFLAQSNQQATFILMVLVFYLSRLFYTSLRLGLYSMPLSLGLFLSVPTNYSSHLSSKTPYQFSRLELRTAKIKLFKTAHHYQAFAFDFSVGQSTLILGGPRSGKTALAKLLTGQGFYGRRAWLLKSPKRRYFYQDFFEKYSGFYYLGPQFMSHHSLLETVVGKESYQLTDQDLVRAAGLLSQYPLLASKLGPNFDWRLAANKFLNSERNNLLLQILHCLYNQPFLVAIDNYWLDIDDQEFKELLALLAVNLSQTSLVFFARQQPNFLNYQQIYEIKN